MKDDNTTPLQWPTAVINDTHPGKDHSVPVVTLQTPKGIFKRPITKIFPLPRVINEFIVVGAVCTRIGQFLCNFDFSCIYMWLRYFA